MAAHYEIIPWRLYVPWEEEEAKNLIVGGNCLQMDMDGFIYKLESYPLQISAYKSMYYT